ncbi:Na(+)/H(+) antiporter subunit G domain protein [Porphyromonas sp. oral taxon 278 str. W7784]|nr:Na(+)/H(+) antiporter subunit G domain protein [Porphyromonas sp. oral taxon 278 str. W7784]
MALRSGLLRLPDRRGKHSASPGLTLGKMLYLCPCFCGYIWGAVRRLSSPLS